MSENVSTSYGFYIGGIALNNTDDIIGFFNSPGDIIGGLKFNFSNLQFYAKGQLGARYRIAPIGPVFNQDAYSKAQLGLQSKDKENTNQEKRTTEEDEAARNQIKEENQEESATPCKQVSQQEEKQKKLEQDQEQDQSQEQFVGTIDEHVKIALDDTLKFLIALDDALKFLNNNLIFKLALGRTIYKALLEKGEVRCNLDGEFFVSKLPGKDWLFGLQFPIIWNLVDLWNLVYICKITVTPKGAVSIGKDFSFGLQMPVIYDYNDLVDRYKITVTPKVEWNTNGSCNKSCGAVIDRDCLIYDADRCKITLTPKVEWNTNGSYNIGCKIEGVIDQHCQIELTGGSKGFGIALEFHP